MQSKTVSNSTIFRMVMVYGNETPRIIKEAPTIFISTTNLYRMLDVCNPAGLVIMNKIVKKV